MPRFFVVNHLRIAPENLGLDRVVVFNVLLSPLESFSDSNLPWRICRQITLSRFKIPNSNALIKRDPKQRIRTLVPGIPLARRRSLRTLLVLSIGLRLLDEGPAKLIVFERARGEFGRGTAVVVVAALILFGPGVLGHESARIRASHDRVSD